MTREELLGSCIESLSADQVNERILTFMDGIVPPKALGWLVLVAIYTPENADKYKKEDGTYSAIIRPNNTVEQERFRSCTGMVVNMGPVAYVGDKFANTGPWCRLGEWITFPRHEGTQINYRGKPMMWLPDDRVALSLGDPSYVSRV